LTIVGYLLYTSPGSRAQAGRTKTAMADVDVLSTSTKSVDVVDSTTSRPVSLASLTLDQQREAIDVVSHHRPTNELTNEPNLGRKVT
jgi:hypothetical protein